MGIYCLGKGVEIMTIGDRFKSFRNKKNMSGTKVAEHLHMAQSQYSRLERGETVVTFDRIESFCKLIGITIAQFFDDEGSMFSPSEIELIHNFRKLDKYDQYEIKQLISMKLNKQHLIE